MNIVCVFNQISVYLHKHIHNFYVGSEPTKACIISVTKEKVELKKKTFF